MKERQVEATFFVTVWYESKLELFKKPVKETQSRFSGGFC
jgi:hypothetical protein